MSSRAKEMLKKFRKTKTMITKNNTDIKPFVFAEFHTEKKVEDFDPLHFLERHSIQIEPTQVDEFLDIKPKKNAEKRKIQPSPLTRKNTQKLNDVMANIRIKLLNTSFSSKSSDESEKENYSLYANTRVSTKESSTVVLPDLSEYKSEKPPKTLFRTKRGFKLFKEKKKKMTIIVEKAKKIQEKPKINNELKNRINKVLSSVKLPNKCILDNDVQMIEENEPFIPPIKKLTNIDLLSFMK